MHNCTAQRVRALLVALRLSKATSARERSAAPSDCSHWMASWASSSAACKHRKRSTVRPLQTLCKVLAGYNAHRWAVMKPLHASLTLILEAASKGH